MFICESLSLEVNNAEAKENEHEFIKSMVE